MEKKLIILAGNKSQFDEYVMYRGFPEGYAVYGYDSRSVRTVRASNVEIIGTFWNKPDASQLLELANSRIF